MVILELVQARAGEVMAHVDWIGGIRHRFRSLVSHLLRRTIPAPDQGPLPTVFHITHWKAGSQWIHKVLTCCARERIVPAEPTGAQFLERPLLPGKVYLTCYLTREQFESVPLPDFWRRFVVIRDLRDTLVSWYFSLRYSHPLLPDSGVAAARDQLNSRDTEDGFLCLINHGLRRVACIQQSWLDSGERLIRYEDLLEHDEAILVPLLTERCPLGVSAERVRQAVVAARFENLTRGRSRGQEDQQAHERKGIAGDWRNHFTDRIKREFKARYGDLLIATGYEKDHHW